MSNRIVLTTSLDPFLDRRLRGDAPRCLALLRSLAGHARTFTTLTSSLAKQLGRCTNTIRNYRADLVAAGYIWWTTDPRTGHTTVLIREAVEPPSRRAALADPQGGAQIVAAVKTRPVLTPSRTNAAACASAVRGLIGGLLGRPRPMIQPPARTVAEQIAALGLTLD